MSNCESGIYLFDGNGNNVTCNKIIHTFQDVLPNFEGIHIGDWGGTSKFCNNFIINNVIDGYQHGMEIRESASDNVISGNIIKNSDYGIYLRSSNDNTFYLNKIVDNTIQVYSQNSMNSWDNGTKGNYWSDYSGVDVDNDGIGDSPYIIDERNRDNYPPVEIPSSPPRIPEFNLVTPLVISLVMSIYLLYNRRVLRSGKKGFGI